MENTNTPSTKGKGLGTAGMIVSLVALVWAIIPLAGAGAIWLAIPGLILSLIAFFMAKGGGNPKKGMMIAGIVMGVIALALAIYWISTFVAAVNTGLDNFGNMDTAAARKAIEDALNK
ncbi:MAG: hypothetical protein ACK5Z2_17550 [Bacteroidota bacterium]|jgi:hypothetical protein